MEYLDSMVRCVGNFCRQSRNDLSAMFVIHVWPKTVHQPVSDGHVDYVGRRQLELKSFDVDAAQHKPYKLIFCITVILDGCWQQVDSCTAATDMLITLKPATRLLK